MCLLPAPLLFALLPACRACLSVHPPICWLLLSPAQGTMLCSACPCQVGSRLPGWQVHRAPNACRPCCFVTTVLQRMWSERGHLAASNQPSVSQTCTQCTPGRSTGAGAAERDCACGMAGQALAAPLGAVAHRRWGWHAPGLWWVRPPPWLSTSLTRPIKSRNPALK